MKCGILGLPNVGKSTLFNLLTGKRRAKVGNFPFCTIDPNRADGYLYDQRLVDLSKTYSSNKTIFASISTLR